MASSRVSLRDSPRREGGVYLRVIAKMKEKGGKSNTVDDRSRIKDARFAKVQSVPRAPYLCISSHLYLVLCNETSSSFPPLSLSLLRRARTILTLLFRHARRDASLFLSSVRTVRSYPSLCARSFISPLYFIFSFRSPLSSPRRASASLLAPLCVYRRIVKIHRSRRDGKSFRDRARRGGVA